MPYHKRYHGDILNAYVGMTLEERGAYDTILELLYDRQQPLPNDMRWIAGWFGCSLRKARALIAALLAKGKIYLRDDSSISNRRWEFEHENLLKTSRTQSENALKRKHVEAETDDVKSENNNLAEPPLENGYAYQKLEVDVEEEKKDETIVSSKEKKVLRRKGEEPEGFAEWYAVFPRHVAPKDAAKAYGHAAKEVPRDVLLAAAKRYAASVAGKEAQFVKLPATWLNKGCWMDEDTTKASESPVFRIQFETPQWDAWRAYEERTRGSAKWMDAVARNRGVAMFPTEWPPALKLNTMEDAR